MSSFSCQCHNVRVEKILLQHRPRLLSVGVPGHNGDTDVYPCLGGIFIWHGLMITFGDMFIYLHGFYLRYVL